MTKTFLIIIRKKYSYMFNRKHTKMKGYERQESLQKGSLLRGPPLEGKGSLLTGLFIGRKWRSPLKGHRRKWNPSERALEKSLMKSNRRKRKPPERAIEGSGSLLKEL
jgi:hypothetical protein